VTSQSHVKRAYFTGKLLIILRDKGKPVPPALAKLESAYTVSTSAWRSPEPAPTLNLWWNAKMSLRAALSLLPLDNLVDSGRLRDDHAKALRAARRALIGSFSSERGATVAWTEEVAALLQKYSSGLSDGSRSQFLHQRHRAIETALTTAEEEVGRLKGLVTKNMDVGDGLKSLLKSLSDARTQHSVLKEKLNKDTAGD